MRAGLAAALLAALVVQIPGTASLWAKADDVPSAQGSTVISGTVTDALGRPLTAAALKLRTQSGAIAARALSDDHGAFSFPPVALGVYAIIAEKHGFRPATAIVEVSARSSRPVVLAMESERALSLQVTAHRLNQARNDIFPQTGSSVYHFSEQDIENLPAGENTSLTQTLVQAPGVNQDAYDNGNFHVRGVDGQVQYRINGVFLPEMDTSFGMVTSPRFAHNLDLLDGALGAEFGYRTAGVIDIHTKTGCTNQGGQAEMYGGQRATYQPSFEYGGCNGRLDYYVGGYYLQNDRGVQPPTEGPVAIHDRTNQGQGLGYFSYLIDPDTRLTLLTGTAVNFFQIPNTPGVPQVYQLNGVPIYPSADLKESQLEQNYFGVLALQGKLGQNFNYQAAAFSRYERTQFFPDPIGDLIYNGVASNVLNGDYANGVQGDFSYRLSEAHTIHFGFFGQEEAVNIDTTSLVFSANSEGQQISDVPFSIVDNLNKLTWLGGLYVQDQWRVGERMTLLYGARFDYMDQFVTAWAFEPRIGATYKLDPATTLHAGYARYFTPPSLETLSYTAIEKFSGTTNAAAVPGNDTVQPERDNYFDAGIVRRITPHLNLSLDNYFKLADQMLDSNQFGNALIFTPTNYAHGRSWGSELSLTYAKGSLSGYFNFSYEVLQATDVTTMQFTFDPDELPYIAGHYVTLDQSQLFTASSGATYRWNKFLFTFDSIFGSGLRDGFANTAYMPSYFQFNAAIGRSFDLLRIGRVDTRLVIINAFDHIYEIRNGTGIGVNQANFAPRRTLYLDCVLPFSAAGASNRSLP
jgi:outer membrane receptor protein involved in Fe transport